MVGLTVSRKPVEEDEQVSKVDLRSERGKMGPGTWKWEGSWQRVMRSGCFLAPEELSLMFPVVLVCWR